MDFAALPPEINSGRMYTGPGSASMLAAAGAWNELAADLYATAENYGSVISGLTSGPWLGVSSTAMASAAAPYTAWLTATAAQAEQTGAQAKAAAAAHATAVAMTVPPSVVAANRAQLLTLVATNIFGQNTPAIAANEAAYAEMWVQDATAMHGYAAASQVASTVTPFTSPQQNTNPNGLAAQNAASSQAAGSSAGQAMSGLSQALQGVPPTPPTPPPTPTGLDAAGALAGIFALPQGALFDTGIIAAFIPEYLTAAANLPTPFGLGGVSPAAIAAAEPFGLIPVMESAGLAGASGGASASAGLASASAGVGQASSMSGLSVPQAWATAAPEMRLAAAELPAPNFVPAMGSGSMFGNTPLVGGAPLMALPGRNTGDSKNGKSQEEEKRKAEKGRRSTMR